MHLIAQALDYDILVLCMRGRARKRECIMTLKEVDSCLGLWFGIFEKSLRLQGLSCNLNTNPMIHGTPLINKWDLNKVITIVSLLITFK